MQYKIWYYGNSETDLLAYHNLLETRAAFRLVPLRDTDLSVERLKTFPQRVRAVIIDKTTLTAEEVANLINLFSQFELPMYFWLDFGLYNQIPRLLNFNYSLADARKKLPILYDLTANAACNTMIFA